MPRRPDKPTVIALATLALAILAFYARALPRYFTSEDFLLLRFLREHPPWTSPAEFLSSSWLGISAVRFYRPVSTLMFAAEARIFGAHPLAYNAVHLAVHFLNAVLVWRIARRIAGTGEPAWTPIAIGLLFALYPLHPNAVSFIASFATLFSGTFLLLAVDAYQRRADASAVVAFLLALGSYEAAVTLPGLLVAHDLLLPSVRGSEPSDRWSGRLRRWAPFGAAVVAYLILRRGVLGVTLGGYEEAGRRLLAPELESWIRGFSLSVWWLHIPVFDRVPRPAALVSLTLVLVVAPLLVFLLRSRAANEGRRWLFGWAWIALALLPFSFEPVVPGDGRYWYFASVGLAMTVCFLLRWALAPRGALRHVAPAAVAALAIFWASLLAHYLGIYLAAGETTRAIQQRILELPTDRSGEGPLFVTGCPPFLVNSTQTPIAQVFHYGLADAVHPPFANERRIVYPLPPITDVELAAVWRGHPEPAIARWNAATSELQPCHVAPEASLAELAPLVPADGAILDRARLEVQVRSAPGVAVYRLILVAEGNATTLELGPLRDGDGVVRAVMPWEFVETMQRLYGSEMFWWIEGLDPGGAPAAASPLRRFSFHG